MRRHQAVWHPSVAARHDSLGDGGLLGCIVPVSPGRTATASRCTEEATASAGGPVPPRPRATRTWRDYAWCGWRRRGVQVRAGQRLPHGKPQDDTERCGQRNGNEQAHEAEQIAEGEQRKHQPDRVELDPAMAPDAVKPLAAATMFRGILRKQFFPPQAATGLVRPWRSLVLRAMIWLPHRNGRTTSHRCDTGRPGRGWSDDRNAGSRDRRSRTKASPGSSLTKLAFRPKAEQAEQAWGADG